MLGDEGSGYAIGLAALRAAVRASDGRGPRTALVQGMLERTGGERPEDLIGWAAAASKADIASLAPDVVAAGADDAVAHRIVRGAARELARHVAALHARLGPWAPPPVVAPAGGLLAPGRPLRPHVLDALDELDAAYRPLERPVDAARGAAVLAGVPSGAA